MFLCSLFQPKSMGSVNLSTCSPLSPWGIVKGWLMLVVLCNHCRRGVCSRDVCSLFLFLLLIDPFLFHWVYPIYTLFVCLKMIVLCGFARKLYAFFCAVGG